MQESIDITHPYEHIGRTNVTVWGANSPEKLAEYPVYTGRFIISVDTGCAYMRLCPTADEGRKLIALLERAVAEVEAQAA